MRLIGRGLRCGGSACLGAAVAAAIALGGAPIALGAITPVRAATTPFQTITSTGPLSNIWLGDDLDCQVQYESVPTYEFFPSSGAPGDCGTLVSVGGTLYGPDFAANSNGTATPFQNDSDSSYAVYTRQAQSGISGSGTAASPYAVATSVAVGSTGLTISQTDSYVVGNEYYRTDITVANASGAAIAGSVYKAGDCYLQDSDSGYGAVANGNSPACAESANNSPPNVIEEFAPLSGSSHYLEGGFSTVWADIAARTDLPGTCDCTVDEDDGAGVNWDFSIPAGGSQTFSLLTSFSATGSFVDAPDPTAPPTISGSPVVGQVLAEGHGSWMNAPTGFDYQWQDCDATGANCTAIAGATAATYTVTGSDVGQTIRVLETATNAVASGGPTASAPTAVVQSAPTSVTPTPPTAAATPVSLTTTQTSGTASGASLTVPAGTTGETDRATLAGANATLATGTITYRLYRASSCSQSSQVLGGAALPVSGSAAPVSAAIGTVLVPGTYYWRASYSGDAQNLPALSQCGAERLTVSGGTTVASGITASPAGVHLKVGCKVVPCQLSLTISVNERVEVPSAIVAFTTNGQAKKKKKKKKKRFHTIRLTLATDSLHISRSGDFAIDAVPTRRGKRYLRSHRGRVRLQLTLTERIKSTTIVSEQSVEVKLSSPPQVEHHA